MKNVSTAADPCSIPSRPFRLNLKFFLKMHTSGPFQRDKLQLLDHSTSCGFPLVLVWKISHIFFGGKSFSSTLPNHIFHRVQHHFFFHKIRHFQTRHFIPMPVSAPASFPGNNFIRQDIFCVFLAKGRLLFQDGSSFRTWIFFPTERNKHMDGFSRSLQRLVLPTALSSAGRAFKTPDFKTEHQLHMFFFLRYGIAISSDTSRLLQNLVLRLMLAAFSSLTSSSSFQVQAFKFKLTSSSFQVQAFKLKKAIF